MAVVRQACNGFQPADCTENVKALVQGFKVGLVVDLMTVPSRGLAVSPPSIQIHSTFSPIQHMHIVGRLPPSCNLQPSNPLISSNVFKSHGKDETRPAAAALMTYHDSSCSCRSPLVLCCWCPTRDKSSASSFSDATLHGDCCRTVLNFTMPQNEQQSSGSRDKGMIF